MIDASGSPVTIALIDPFKAVKDLVLRGCVSVNTRRSYEFSLSHFLNWYSAYSAATGAAFDRQTFREYKKQLIDSGLAGSSVNTRLAAVRMLAVEAASAKLIDHADAYSISTVKGVKDIGRRLGNWLDAGNAESLIGLPNTCTLAGKRDRAVLCVSIGCGLRRDEVAKLTYAHVQQREGRWLIVDLIGKGERTRSIPMPNWCKAAIDIYFSALLSATTNVDSNAPLLWRIGKNGKPISAGVTTQAIYHIVRHHAKALGFANLAPHDLRRTFCKLAYKGKSDIRQIKESMGHSSVQTTERYLGVDQDLTDAPCDHLGIEPKIIN